VPNPFESALFFAICIVGVVYPVSLFDIKVKRLISGWLDLITGMFGDVFLTSIFWEIFDEVKGIEEQKLIELQVLAGVLELYFTGRVGNPEWLNILD
jgi:hypothetical protein